MAANSPAQGYWRKLLKIQKIFQQASGVWCGAVSFTPIRTQVPDLKQPCRAEWTSLFYANRKEESIPWFQKAAQLEPKETGWWNYLCRVLLDTGKDADAIAALSHVVPTNAADASLFYNLGIANANRGNRRKAEEFLRKSVQMNPNDSQANALLGRLLLQDSNMEEGVNYLYSAVNSDPNNLDAQ